MTATVFEPNFEFDTITLANFIMFRALTTEMIDE